MENQPYSQIIVHNQYNHATYELESQWHEWRGDNPLALIQVMDDYADRDLKKRLEAGGIITLGDLRLRIVDVGERFANNQWVVARDGWRARWYQYSRQYTRSIDTFYRRLILTVAIWGLADYNRWNNVGELPSWRHLKWFRPKEKSCAE